MNNNVSISDKATAWAAEEAKKDLDYWLDRAANGNGLIKQIANFVLKHKSGDTGAE
jgi:hypothetical protein